MNILLMDDMQTRHDLVEKYFVKSGHSILHAFNPIEAIEIVSSFAGTIRLALLDHDLNCFKNDADEFVPFEYEGKKREITGKHFVRDMVEIVPQAKWPLYSIIHSHNYDGAMGMLQLLSDAGAHGTLRRFSSDMLEQLIRELDLS